MFMKNIVEKYDLIVIALVYNYLANNRYELPERFIDDFINATFKNLISSDNNYEVSDELLEVENYEGYLFAKKESKYILKSIEHAGYLYNFQSDDVIMATLQENALNSIDVERENLRLERSYKRKSGVVDVYSLEAKRASESAKKILENKGYTGIKIGSITPDQLDGDKGYHVSYICDEPVYKVKVSKRKN